MYGKTLRQMPPAQPEFASNVVHGVFQAFDRREDDFSISLALTDDPIFWLRLDRNGAPGTLLFTDFKAGEQSDPVMARALATLLSAEGGASVTTLVFHDLVPGDHDPAQYRLRLNRIAQDLRGWSETAARMTGRRIRDVSQDAVDGKARLLVSLV